MLQPACLIDLSRPFSFLPSWRPLREQNGTEVPVRIGISAGEPVTDDDDLFGAAVQLAARLSGYGTAGDVWVSRPVRDLCIGKTIRFSEARTATLKGFAEPVEVFLVPWK